MRLIDADELVKFLKGCTMSNGTLINTNTMLSVIDKMPTAYNVDKVAAELEDFKINGTNLDKADYKWNLSLIEAIDVVKRGGAE